MLLSRKSLAQLRILDSSTTYPLLLQLYRRRAEDRLTDAGLAEALQLLSGFIFRRLVCGEGSRSYGDWFAEACRTLDDDPVGNLRLYLERRGHPETPRFAEAFVRFNLYGSRYRKSVLELLERQPTKSPPI